MADVLSFAAKPELKNQEAERQLIGAVLFDCSILHSIAGTLKPEHFSVPQHAEIYRAARRLVADGKKANPVTLKPLIEDGLFSEGAARYMMACVKDHASALVVPDYALQILDYSVKRQTLQTFQEIEYELGSADGTEYLISRLDDLLTGIRSAIPRKDLNPEQVTDLAPAFVQRLMDMRSGEIPAPPSTGLRELDLRIGGYAKGELHVVGGRPGQGKTIFGVAGMRSIVRQRATKERPYGAIYFSLEVPAWDIMNRLVSLQTRFDQRPPIPYTNIKRPGILSDEELERITVHANHIRQWPIAIVDQPGVTLSQIEGKLREQITAFEKCGQSLDVVFIDYLGLIKPSDRYKGYRVQEIAEISAGLVSIAKRYNVAVVALSQLSRNVENRENKIPNLADLRDSGSIEQDANNVIFLHRPAYYAAKDDPDMPPADDNVLTLNVDKARDGMTGIIQAYVDVATNYLCDAQRGT